jgi:hypothetical protein
MTPQMNLLLRAQRHNFHQNLERCANFNERATTFLLSISPNMGDLIEHTQRNHQEPPHRAAIKLSIPSTFLTPSANRATRESVRQEYKAMEASGVYGWIESDKPDNVIRVMYENLSSLSLFAKGNTVVSRLDMYRTNVLMYRTMVLLVHPTKVRC